MHNNNTVGAIPTMPLNDGVAGAETLLLIQPIEHTTCNAPEPMDVVCECLADRFFGTPDRPADGLMITTSAPDEAILFDSEAFATDHTLTHLARGKAVFTRIVECVASTLTSSGADEADARAAAHAFATQLGTPEFAELPRLAATNAMPTSLRGSPRSSTHITLTPEAKVRVRHELWWTPPVDSSAPPYDAIETEKTASQEFRWHVQSLIWLEREREISSVSSTQAGGAARFGWHVQVEAGSLTNVGADPSAEPKSGCLGFDDHACDELARLWSNAGFRVVPRSVVGGPPGDGGNSDLRRFGVVREEPRHVGFANWQRPQPPKDESGEKDVASSRSAELPGGLIMESLSQHAVPGPELVSVSMNAPPQGPRASAPSSNAPHQVSSGARDWWTPTLYGSWLAAAAAYLAGTVVQFFEKVQSLGSAATMQIYPVMQGGALAEVLTVWWQGRKQAAEQKLRNEELGKVAPDAAAFSQSDAEFKRQAAKLKAQAGARLASGGQLNGPELAVDNGGQTDVTQRTDGDEVNLGRPSVEGARAALKRAELTTLSAVASLPARANTVWYVRDVYVQAGATAVRLLNWAGTKFGFLISPLLGAFTGLFGAVGGVLHIVQGTIERTRATQYTDTLKNFKVQVLGLPSGEDAALKAGASIAATSVDRLEQLDRRLRVDKSGSRGKASFQTLLGRSDEFDLDVASKLADVVQAKLSKNAEHLMEAAEKQRRNANIRIGFGVGSATLSAALGAFAYLGIGGVVALAVTTGVVGLAVGWLGFAVVEWVKARRDERRVTAPTPDDIVKIKAWADADLKVLEEKFLAEDDPEKFFIGALMARYLALSTKFGTQEESSMKLDAQQQARKFNFLKIRVRVTKRMCIQAAIDEFRALREVSEAAVQNHDKGQFIDIVTSITQHIEGKRGLERRLAAAANLATASRAA